MLDCAGNAAHIAGTDAASAGRAAADRPDDHRRRPRAPPRRRRLVHLARHRRRARHSVSRGRCLRSGGRRFGPGRRGGCERDRRPLLGRGSVRDRGAVLRRARPPVPTARRAAVPPSRGTRTAHGGTAPRRSPAPRPRAHPHAAIHLPHLTRDARIEPPQRHPSLVVPLCLETP
ncbi:hypothetical protein F6A08_04605 [Microbacterium algeriense]|uniref:Uncharacterized protein n=1 Tax=Microbacterium algeriense TaxID=2615184 RepID=A0ABQ6VAG2_9MICO|nr:hypothetical protein F6A08_04605 [Microbacterium algeriense]